MLGTRPEVFQTIWDATSKINDDWIRFYTAISVLEDLRPTDAKQRRGAIAYVLDTGKRVPKAEQPRVLFQLAWKLPELDREAAISALNDLLKQFPFGKDPPTGTVICGNSTNR